MLGVTVLGSGSAGNAVVITTPDTRVLVDAGLSARQLESRIVALGLEPDSFDAIVLTHEHGDHTRGLGVFCRRRPIPIYCNRHTQRVVAESLRDPPPWKLIESGQRFRIRSLEIDAFSVPHDAVDPMGYTFGWQGGKIAVLTDLGHASTLVLEKARGAHTIVLEANYDDELLAHDTKRPWATKHRISSRHGHLSNAQAAEFAAQLVPDGLRRVVLAHLSRDCNSPDAARRAFAHLPDLEIHCACQDNPTAFCTIPTAPPPPVAPTAGGPLVQGQLF